MPSQTDNRRPYASVSSVLAVIDRARSMNLPETIDAGFMNVAGVDGQSVSRTRDALAFLGLIDESGSRTQTFEDLANVSGSEFPVRLRQVVEAAYAEELSLIDPKVDDAEKIRGVFQKYTPKSTTGKMVSLFLGLCRAGGMEIKDPPPMRAAASSTPKREASTRSTRPAGRSGQKAREPSPDPPSVLVHGISMEDIAALKKDEFEGIWQTLGTLIWLRLHQDSNKERQPLPLPANVESEGQ